MYYSNKTTHLGEPFLLLIAPDGRAHRFSGDSVEGVVAVSTTTQHRGRSRGNWWTEWTIDLAPGVRPILGHGGWTDMLGSSWAAVARSLGVEEAEARRFLAAERPGAAKWLCERAGEATPAQVAAQEAARSAEQVRAAAVARVQRPYYDPSASDEEALADFGDLVPDLLSALRAAEKVPAMWGRAFALGLILLPAEAHVARFRLARLAAASEERHVALLDALEAWGYPRSLDVAIPELGSTTPLARLARAATAERQRVVREQIAREDHSEHGWGVSAAGLGGE